MNKVLQARQPLKHYVAIPCRASTHFRFSGDKPSQVLVLGSAAPRKRKRLKRLETMAARPLSVRHRRAEQGRDQSRPISLMIAPRTAVVNACRANSSPTNEFLNDLGNSICTPAPIRPLLQMLKGLMPCM